MRNQKGVTLIELLIVILIMVSISALAFSLFSYGTKMERTVAIENELHREAHLIIETISNKVRDGENLEINKNLTLSNKELKLNSIVLSNHVKKFKFEPDAIDPNQYKVELMLEMDSHEYKVSTKVLANGEERIIR
jgi:prepilin-type N-terminal cleavage/methylation domain-containing protein